MKSNKQIFPFGSVSVKVEQKEKSPKKVFVLGSQAESVYAHLLDDKGKVKAMAVPVASEPFPFWNGEGASQLLQNISIPSEFEKLTPVNINYNGGFGKKIDKWFLKPLGYKREDVWFCYLQPFARINPGKLKNLKEVYSSLSKGGYFSECTIPVFNPSEFYDKSRVQEIISELEQSQAKTIILIGEMPVKHFISHFSTYKSLSDFGNTILNYGKIHIIKINRKPYRVMALTHPEADEKFRTGSYFWKRCHKYWYAKNRLIEAEKILKGKDPTFVDKKPTICPICYCRKIAKYEIERSTLFQKEKRDIREGRLILKKEISEDDPIYICTECEFEFYDKKVERKFQLA